VSDQRTFIVLIRGAAAAYTGRRSDRGATRPI